MTAAPMTAAETRRSLAEEIRVTANIRLPRIVDAIRSVPRDKFLPPGPWIIKKVKAVRRASVPEYRPRPPARR